MPHLVILYTGNLESRTDVSALCRGLVDVMLQRRGDAVHRDVGEALNALVRKHFAPLQDREHMGIPADIDLGAEVYDANMSSLHPLFNKLD